MKKYTVTCTDDVCPGEDYVRSVLPSGKALHHKKGKDGKWKPVEFSLGDDVALSLERDRYTLNPSPSKKAAKKKDGAD